MIDIMTRARIRALAVVAALSLAPGLILAFPASAGDSDDPDPVSPDRIVSVGGAVTEIVFALGAQQRLVAVDSTSLYPAEAAALPDVGYMRQLSAEPILGLDPALILAVEDAGPQSALDQLHAAGVPIVLVPDEPTPQGVLRKVETVAGALGLKAEGKALKTGLETDFALLSAAIGKVESRPRVLFLLSVGDGSGALAAGRGTSAAGIVALAGGRNAIDAFDGFKPLSPEAIVLAAPDVLLVPQRTLHQPDGVSDLRARPDIAATPAGRNGRIVAIDDLLLLGFGPRTPEAIRSLAAALHPGLSLPAAPTE